MNLRTAFQVGLAAVVIAVVGAPLASPPGDRNPDESRHLAPNPAPERPANLPIPILPPTPGPGAGGDETLNLLGFSTETFAGNRGILNMTRACQEQFSGSRVCTAGEILRSINIPASPAPGFVWVQSATTFSTAGISDCGGWTSNAATDRAWAIELGPDHGCYGGFHPRSCDQQLAVACCGRRASAEIEPLD